MVTVVQGKVCAKNHPDRLSRLPQSTNVTDGRTDGRTDFLWHRPDLTVGQKWYNLSIVLICVQLNRLHLFTATYVDLFSLLLRTVSNMPCRLSMITLVPILYIFFAKNVTLLEPQKIFFGRLCSYWESQTSAHGQWYRVYK